jgi:hypothetical protein
LLMPPRPDMTSSFGIEPCISSRTSFKKDIGGRVARLNSTRAADGLETDALADSYSTLRRRHSTRRDGPVMNRTGNTTSGVVTSASKKVPQNPMRRWVPENPVSRHTRM